MININGVKTIATIYTTKEYDKFKFIKCNRPIERNNVENLKISMLENKHIIYPILVNEKFEIIDGQHRFTAWTELEREIQFYVQEGIGEAEMIQLNINRASWTPKDYLNYFVDQNNDDYIKFKKIIDNYNIAISDLLTIIDKLSGDFIGEVAMGRLFKAGKLQMNIDDILSSFFKDLCLFKESKNYLGTYFIRAFLKLYLSEFYDSEYIEQRVKVSSVKIQNSKKGYIIDQCKFLADLYTSKVKGVTIVYEETSELFYSINRRKLK